MHILATFLYMYMCVHVYMGYSFMYANMLHTENEE